ncbi:hypothetical protein B9G98_00292 [Wickerhamiella sorbophila]|uniref:CoA-binding domain-containing protein n=1 Tax=Wickerhamiella sorbophila TaxID=45607 RepID=A0A2T0FCE1_9ASCO|nr:hypothetical protein B9G98_00292 [Wickerhamiella sorbophila]PRT52672.1 hypothetical protein B9G98_00292 [Wickerhamiella sorbophila]
MDSFFKANRVYAVAGASSNPSKFGYKVLKWYKDRNIPAVPINFRKEVILEIPSVEDVTQVPVKPGQDVAISVVSPPAVTQKMLESLDKAQGNVEAVWLQPGTYDQAVLALAQEKVPNVITDCILVKGDNYLPSKL